MRVADRLLLAAERLYVRVDAAIVPLAVRGAPMTPAVKSLVDTRGTALCAASGEVVAV